MNLIKKLGVDFFKEKFNKGIFRIENKLFLVLDVQTKITDKSEEIKQLTKELKEAAYNAECALDEHMDRRPDKYTDAVYDEANEIYDEDEHESVDEFIDDNMPNSPVTEEYTTWVLAKTQLVEARANTQRKWITFMDEERNKAGLAVSAIDFEKGAVVQVDENEFKSIRMFWDFEEGYRVLKTEGDTGFPMWVGPSLTGARCIKLQQREARVKNKKEMSSNDEINLYRYGFYIENNRWKDIITPKGLPFKEALKLAVETKDDKTGEEGAVLIEGGKAFLKKERGISPTVITLYYQEMPIAQLTAEGTPLKVRKGMLAIAEEEGSVPCLTKK